MWIVEKGNIMSKLYWAKTNKNAIIPTKKLENGGHDIYACIEGDLQINPNEVVLIPTGIATSFDNKYVGIIKERGSTGTKGMSVRAGVIDSGFRGEWKIAIQNTNKIPILISDSEITYNGVLTYPKSKAIAQVVFQEVPVFEETEIAYDTLINIKSERGTSMLGESGK